VVVADDHHAVRAMIARLLEPDFDVVAAVGTGKDLLAAIAASQPDAAVVDIFMPDMTGIEAVRRLPPSLHPAIVFLTTVNDPALAAEALCRGGQGYVLKGSAAFDLVPALRAALAGRTFISSPLH